MKKFGLLTAAFLMMGLLFGSQVMAQHIELGTAKSAQNCAQVTDNGFTASFSFSSIDATEVSTEKGVFSTITMEGTYPSGNVGEPMLPAANKLIAVPFGAKDLTVTVKSYSTSTYRLADYGINKVTPMQPMLRKDQKPEDVPFAYSEKAYAVKGFAGRPIAEVKIQGTMRGIQIGALTVNPVQYDAASNSILVFNDIEVEVSYGAYDKSAAYNEFSRTFSPYFANIYGMMFNWRDDVYDEHPDLWQNPVHMLIIADRMFEECLQPWYEWKTTKGFYLNINYTDEIGTSAAAIRAFIQDEYSKDAPTFLMIMGDKNQVAASATGSETHCVTDLQYSSVDGDQYPDMYHSRFPAETVTQMMAMVEKALEYEQYTMPDPSYLNNVLLIAGEDNGWGVTVGRPTIWYATNYYYNTEHGYDQVHEYSHGQYTGCYTWLNEGVGFANYTAHGSNTSWAGPQFTVSDVNNLTNQDKYFLAMGNCCEAADWGINGTCFGEAMVRAEKKAAYAYIGSCPSTYWLNDYYFGVGATSRHDGTMPSYEETTMGFYDAMWTDDAYNTVTSMMFIGNLASNAAQALGYELHCSTLYDWQAYHTLGDGSILPFRIQPTENTVSHMPTLPIGMDFFTVSADPGSYVGITKDGILYGAGMIGESGSADIAISPITSGGDVTICVTHPQRIPYTNVIPAAAMDGAYIAVDNVQCEQPLVTGAYVAPTVTLKNVGVETANNVNVVLSTESEYIELLNTTATVPSIAPDAVYEIEDAFAFNTAVDIPNGTRVRFFVNCTSGSDTWEGRFDLTFGAPEFVMTNISNTELQPGGSAVVTFDITNNGGFDAQNAVLQIVSSSSDLTFEVNSIEIPAIAAGETVSVSANLNVSANAQIGATYELSYLVSDGHYILNGTAPISVGNVADGFETGDFSTFDYTFAGSANWTIVNTGAYEGTYCAKSGNISDNQDSQLVLTVEVLTTGEFSFYKKVSSENSYDKLYFLIDGSSMGDWSGENDWSQQTYTVTPGTHTFKWRYAKDSSVSNGSDCAWIDYIQLPPTSVILSLDPVTDLVANVNGSNVNLTWTAPAGATSYFIYRNGEEVGNQASTSFMDIVNDGVYSYSVVATDGNGRYSAPEYVSVSVGTVGVEENTLEIVSIYPNPVNSMLTIDGGNAEYSYALYNGMGQIVANGNAQGIEHVNVSDMAKGVYFLRLTTGTQVRVEKVVVE
ncbi:MAG: T9SS type A sorting domain-containing protein [Bacteroidales bacterium]|nr:T9SS type A sorting domain-containing protein [Bacteroidales bacterium]